MLKFSLLRYSNGWIIMSAACCSDLSSSLTQNVKLANSEGGMKGIYPKECFLDFVFFWYFFVILTF